MTIRRMFVALVGLLAASPANAILYTGFQTAGATASGTISVRTDGTIGILSASNILYYSIDSTIDGIARSSVSGGPGSDTSLFGSGLSATTTELIFDFGSDGFFGIADFVPGNTGFCVDGTLAPFTCGGEAGSLQFFATISATEFVVASEPRTGVQAIASAVPEPATWLLLTVGTGLAGGGLRLRRQAKASIAGH